MNNEQMAVQAIVKTNIRVERIRAGKTQEEAAELLGITRTQYQKYEDAESETRIDIPKLVELKRIYNCKLSNFLMGLENA